MIDLVPLLAQAVEAAPAAAPAPAPPQPWWRFLLENGLALTILFIFLAAIVTVFLQQRRRDKCLKLLHGFHTTYLNVAGNAIWGDLIVYSQGIELEFDAPHTTRRGLVKSSAMIYPKELPNTLALCRVDYGLSDDEKRQREQQARRTFRPGLFRRTTRWFRNVLATLKDAFVKSMNVLIGALLKTRTGSAVAAQQAEVQQIGQTVLGVAANAYEPMLEAHIGKPVILKIASAADPTKTPTELPGYLVDYTDAYIAVFNVEHTPEETIELDVTESLERPNVKVELRETDVVITCTGPDVIHVRRVVAAGGEQATSDLAVPLLAGCYVALRRPASPFKLVLERTRRIDVVAPRSVATVYFAAERLSPSPRRLFGLAPMREAEDTQAVA